MSRVLLVGKGAPDRGGIPTFLQTLRSSELAELHDITFLNVAHAGTPEGGKVSRGNITRTFQDAWRIFRQGRSHDIVHIHSALAPAVTIARAGLLALAGRLAGCAVIVHAHGGNIETWLTTPRNRFLMRLAMAPAQQVVAVWSAGERALRSALGPDRVRLIVNGVPEPNLSREAETYDPPRVLYVGLLTPRKGVLDLIQASRMLQEEGIRHELRLLGGVPDEGPAAAEPVYAAAEGHATLLGTRKPEEMPQAYVEADVFCLPSWWEAMPLSILEAMESGLPVVASDVGDVARVVEDGRNGYVVPPKAPEKIAEALRPLLIDGELRRQLGAASKQRVATHFSASVTASAVNALYAECTN
jgi:glycosyltransferase involved in cell wall biosynthesis